MTGATVSNSVIDFLNFFIAIAVIVMVVCGALFAVCVSGHVAPYSRWGSFIDRNITGYGSLFGPNFMWYSGVGLLLGLVAWAVLSWLNGKLMQLMSHF